MVTRFKQTAKPRAGAAFTLVEVVISVTILALAMAGMIYGYAQTNYRAEWSSMSLAVQALTVQSVERVRAARWDVYSSSSGLTPDELGNGTNTVVITNIFTNAVLVPSSGATMTVTNVVKISTVSTTPNPPVRQIRADTPWYYTRMQTWYTNTVITYRGGS